MTMTNLGLRFSPRPILFERVALFAGRFEPFCNHHLHITKMLCQNSDTDRVIVWPVGSYDSKDIIAKNEHRESVCRLALEELAPEYRTKVTLRTDDLDLGMFHGNAYMQEMLEAQPSPEGREVLYHKRVMPLLVREVWHVIGTDNVFKVKDWKDGMNLWQKAKFIVLTRKGYETDELPPNSQVLDGPDMISATKVRELMQTGGTWEQHVPGKAAQYIKEHTVYPLAERANNDEFCTVPYAA